MKAKHLFFALLLGIFCLSLTSCAQNSAKEAEVTFIVNMSCISCQREIERNLPDDKGVKNVKANLETKEVWILYQPNKTSKTKLIKAIQKLGYEATEK